MDRSVDTIAEAFLGWLEERFGGPVELVEPVEVRGEGFDSTVVFLRVGGDRLPEPWRQPLVLRVKSDAGRDEEALREAVVQEWVADRGYPAPRVLHVFAAGELVHLPVQAMERAPGTMMLDALRSAPWRARSLCGALALHHVRLHELDPADFPTSDDLLEQRLALSRYVAEALDDHDIGRAFDQVESMAPRLRDAPPSVCHGDYHPLNVLVSGGDATVIDWTDAGIGDRHGDVARTLALFDMAAIAGSNAVERAVLRVTGPWLGRSYRRSYEQALELDPFRIALWLPPHLLHGWAQAVALHAGLLDRDDPTDDRSERVPPALVADLRRRFEAALSEVS